MPSLVKNSSGSYYIVYARGKKRIWRPLHTKNKPTAEKRFDHFKSLDDHHAHIQSLKDAGKDVLKYVEATWAPATLQLYGFTIEKMIREWGNRRVTEITPRDIEMYKAARLKKATVTTVSIELRIIKAFFNRLLEWKQIPENPAKNVHVPKRESVTPAFLTKELFVSLLQSLKSEGNPYHDVLLFAGLTGVRKGELINLRWDDIDMSKRTVIIQNRPDFTTKTGRSRVIPMHPLVFQMLRERERSAKWVFPGDRGYQYNPNEMSHRFKVLIRKNNLDERLHFHSLRHSCASMLVTEGVSLYHVQRILGHTTPRVTQMYAHLGGSDLMDAMSRLDIRLHSESMQVVV